MEELRMKKEYVEEKRREEERQICFCVLLWRGVHLCLCARCARCVLYMLYINIAVYAAVCGTAY